MKNGNWIEVWAEALWGGQILNPEHVALLGFASI
jgi:hypothetical protein